MATHMVWIWATALTVITCVLGQIGEKPSHQTGATGAEVKLICEHIGTSPFEWFEYNSNPTGNQIFLSQNDQPFDQNKYEIEGEYNLIIKQLDFSDGGYYGCKDAFVQSPEKADVVVLGEPSIVIPNLVEGVLTQADCRAQYGGPSDISESHRPRLRMYRDGDQQVTPPAMITPGEPGAPGSNTPWEIKVSFNYTPNVAHNGHNFTCEVYTETPYYSRSDSLILDIRFPVRNIEITPSNTDYFYLTEVINCTAEGNPEPAYQWVPILSSGGSLVNGKHLQINENMVGSNIWTCTATNNVETVEEISETIEFEVLDDPPPGESNRAATLVTSSLPIMYCLFHILKTLL